MPFNAIIMTIIIIIMEGYQSITLYCMCAGIPLVYELDAKLRPITHYYLASEEEVKAAEARVANQGKAK